MLTEINDIQIMYLLTYAQCVGIIILQYAVFIFTDSGSRCCNESWYTAVVFFMAIYAVTATPSV
jgi:hypothetical protein